MVSVKESELFGNAMSMLESLNDYMVGKAGKLPVHTKHYIYGRIVKVIEFIDEMVA